MRVLALLSSFNWLMGIFQWLGGVWHTGSLFGTRSAFIICNTNDPKGVRNGLREYGVASWVYWTYDSGGNIVMEVKKGDFNYAVELLYYWGVTPYMYELPDSIIYHIVSLFSYLLVVGLGVGFLVTIIYMTIAYG